MTVPLPWLPLAGLFDSLEDVVVWVKDREGRYVWVNRAFLLNHAIQEGRGTVGSGWASVVGRTDYDLSPAFLADQFRLDDEFVLAGNRVVDRIEQVNQPDGLTSWSLTNKIPLLDPSGTIVGTAGMTRTLPGPRDGGGSSPTAEFSAVLAYLRDHYQTDVTNRQLARVAHLSVRAFERRFQATFHVTPQKYLRRLRMQIASRELVHRRAPMSEVAMLCGFSDQSHFTREFRRHFGRTPREYRDHYASGS